jgi:formate-dependent nitrite reductase membrane component NrfD
VPGLQSQALADPGSADRRRDLAAALRPLLLDVGIPVGTYYLLRNAFGVSLWLSLALSSIGPAARAITGLVAERKLNLLAVLMLAVNLAGMAVSFLTGDPRAMIAKDSIVSSVIAFAILGSAVLRHPLMSAGLKPFMTRGEPGRTAAWDRLSTASVRFRHLELLFSLIWGLAVLADCAARLVAAYTLPVTTMVWLGTVMTLSTITVAIVAGGAAACPIQKMIDAESAAC